MFSVKTYEFLGRKYVALEDFESCAKRNRELWNEVDKLKKPTPPDEAKQ